MAASEEAAQLVHGHSIAKEDGYKQNRPEEMAGSKLQYLSLNAGSVWIHSQTTFKDYLLFHVFVHLVFCSIQARESMGFESEIHVHKG